MQNNLTSNSNPAQEDFYGIWKWRINDGNGGEATSIINIEANSFCGIQITSWDFVENKGKDMYDYPYGYQITLGKNNVDLFAEIIYLSKNKNSIKHVADIYIKEP